MTVVDREFKSDGAPDPRWFISHLMSQFNDQNLLLLSSYKFNNFFIVDIDQKKTFKYEQNYKLFMVKQADYPSCSNIYTSGTESDEWANLDKFEFNDNLTTDQGTLILK